jgi:hypothetical protein
MSSLINRDDDLWEQRHCADIPTRIENGREVPVIDFYNPKDFDAAKALCAECPVRKQCLQLALDNKETHGVWGGADEKELRRDQAIDFEGKPFNHKIGRIRCPLCGPRSTKYLSVVEFKRTRTHIECTNCGLKWWVRKVITKRLNNF